MSIPFLGILGAAIGIALIVLARRRRARIRAAWAAAKETGAAPGRPIHGSLRSLADIAAPLMAFGLLVAGAEVTLGFVVSGGGGGLFSMADLVGFLLLLLGYGIWFHAKTMYRLDRAPD